MDSRCREIVEAILYYIQESGLQNTLRSGIVLTGGGAELTNFVNLMKEMSGYDVRKGYPRFMFTASVGSGVYSTAATSAIGMILSAKSDNLPDCVSAPQKQEDVETETVEVEVTDETPAPEGALFAPDAFGEAQPKEKPKKTHTVKVSKPKSEKTGFLSIFWKNVEGTALKIYDSANKEEDEEN